MSDISSVYYPYACVICLQADAKIKRCSNCKIAPYCSTSHQKLDWKRSHSHLCKAISACDKKFDLRIQNFQEWAVYRVDRQRILTKMLKRQLNMQETIMNQFSPICVVCYKKDNLYCCKDCLNISYCSIEHESQYSQEHKKFCDKFKLSLISDQYLHFKGQPDIEFMPLDKKELTRAEDIIKYLRFVNFSLGHIYLKKQEELLVLDIIKTERVLLGLNLLYALKLLKLSKEKLIIHIVGASNLELATNWSVVTKILENWLNCSYITYYLIGPEVDQSITNIKNNKYQVIFHSCLYHEVIDKIDKPDLITAFNCGLHEYEKSEYNPWSSTVPKLLYYNCVPLVLTSFTEDEMIKDKNILARVNCKLNILQDIKKNPFAFLKPLRDWASNDEPIFYRCNYIFIVERN